MHFLNAFCIFQCAHFSFLSNGKRKFHPGILKKLTNFRQKAYSSQCRLDSSTFRLQWPAGRHKLSGHTESSLEMLKARQFFGQSRLSWLGETDVGAGTMWCLGCTCTAAVEQHHWPGTQGDVTLQSASAEPHSQPTQQWRPGVSGQAGSAASIQRHTEMNMLHTEKTWALGSQRHILPSRHLLTPAGTVRLSDTIERTN